MCSVQRRKELTGLRGKSEAAVDTVVAEEAAVAGIVKVNVLTRRPTGKEATVCVSQRGARNSRAVVLFCCKAGRHSKHQRAATTKPVDSLDAAAKDGVELWLLRKLFAAIQIHVLSADARETVDHCPSHYGSIAFCGHPWAVQRRSG